MDDLQKMYTVLTAPDALPTTTKKQGKAKKKRATKTLKQVTDDLDGVFAGDMLAHELEELLAASFREAFDTTWRKAQATVNAPKPAPGVTTKQAKGKPKRITTTKGTITFKG